MKDFTKYFKNLTFDPIAHRYTVNGRFFPSVSLRVEAFKPPFEIQEWAEATAKGEGITKQEVLARWKMKQEKSCYRGSSIHNFAEAYVGNKFGLKTNAALNDDYYPEFVAVKKFWEAKPPEYKPVALELKMYNEDYHYAGMTDVVMENTETGNLIVLDYKSNEDLFKGFGDFLYEPFDEYKNIPINLYAIQLSYYALALYMATGMYVERRLIVHLIGEDFKIYDAKDFTGELIDDFELYFKEEDDGFDFEVDLEDEDEEE